MIDTPRLSLRPWDPAHLVALLESAEEFARVSPHRPGPGLRDFFASDDVSPEWVDALRRAAGPDAWTHGCAVVHEPLVIGSAGFKGPPTEDGTVEIAYGIVPAFEGRGFATEVAAGLVAHAFGLDAVQLVRAHTLPENNASTRVLQKNGFRCTGEVQDPDDGAVWRWERERDAEV